MFLISVSSVSAQGFLWEGTGRGGETCNVAGPCTFCDGIIVIRNAIQFLFELSIPIAVVMIVWGALRLMFSGGSEQNVASGRKIITSAVVGLIIALSAWIIVNTALSVLVGDATFPWNQINCRAN